METTLRRLPSGFAINLEHIMFIMSPQNRRIVYFADGGESFRPESADREAIDAFVASLPPLTPEVAQPAPAPWWEALKPGDWFERIVNGAEHPWMLVTFDSIGSHGGATILYLKEGGWMYAYNCRPISTPAVDEAAKLRAEVNGLRTELADVRNSRNVTANSANASARALDDLAKSFTQVANSLGFIPGADRAKWADEAIARIVELRARNARLDEQIKRIVGDVTAKDAEIASLTRFHREAEDMVTARDEEIAKLRASALVVPAMASYLHPLPWVYSDERAIIYDANGNIVSPVYRSIGAAIVAAANGGAK